MPPTKQPEPPGVVSGLALLGLAGLMLVWNEASIRHEGMESLPAQVLAMLASGYGLFFILRWVVCPPRVGPDGRRLPYRPSLLAKAAGVLAMAAWGYAVAQGYTWLRPSASPFKRAVETADVAARQPR